MDDCLRCGEPGRVRRVAPYCDRCDALLARLLAGFEATGDLNSLADWLAGHPAFDPDDPADWWKRGGA